MTAATGAMVVPFAASITLAVICRWLGQHLRPSAAVRLLTLASLTTALASGFSLAVAAFTLAAQNIWLARAGGWTPTAIRTMAPMPAPVGIVAGIIVITLLSAATRYALRTVGSLYRAEMTCRQLKHHDHGLVILDDSHADAYALAGLSGRVVVTTAMLCALSADERRVLLAHETSHLKHRHHLYRMLVGTAAAANPLLRPCAKVVEHCVERWADEDAALQVNDRALAARAVAKAGLARGRSKQSPRQARQALAMSDGPVVIRAQALLRPAPRPRHLLATAVLMLTVATAASAGFVDHSTDSRFDRAQSVACR